MVSEPNPVVATSESLKGGAGRWRVEGKFFALAGRRVVLRGVTYGPFAPDAEGALFPSQEQALADIQLLQRSGVNLLRCYTVPPMWFFDLAANHEISLFVDIPWNYQLAFLDEAHHAEEAIRSVREGVETFGDHPALFAICVANEIPPDIVRWSGPTRVGRFLDELIGVAKAIAPDVLCTFCGFPRTEYLVAHQCDFLCFNVYLEESQAFADYLARLQSIAGGKPLVLGEMGFDSLRHGESTQASQLEEQLRIAGQEGVAGTFVYSFSDEWYKDGKLVTDWAFGVTTARRDAKPALESVARAYQHEPSGRPSDCPMVSVVVAAFDAATTLPACLESLRKLTYPNYEVIVVDDGSSDATPQLLASEEGIRVERHAENRGLSAARNSGIRLSRGEIIAFTDADCRADPQWLDYLVSALVRSDFVGMGGHNLMPPSSSVTAAAVGLAPGGPVQVLLTDRVAEHIPGCNMAFYRSVLDEVGGFDPRFRAAGDDVDLCWRIQQNGHVIGFTAGGFVWHDRRTRVGAYVRQQMGYGAAEAMLAQKFPSLFNWLGNHTWKGRIYDDSVWGMGFSRQIIYRGVYGRGLFQLLSYGRASWFVTFLMSLEFQLLGVGLTFLLGWWIPGFWILTGLSVALTTVLVGRIGWRAHLPREHHGSWRCRFLVAWLHVVQPVVRSFARYRQLWRGPGRGGVADGRRFRASAARLGWRTLRQQYWAESEGDRIQLIRRLHDLLTSAGWSAALDDGYQEFDVAAHLGIWGRLEFLSAEEYFPGNRRQVRARLRIRWSRAAWGAIGGAFLGCGLLAGAMISYGASGWYALALPIVVSMGLVWRGRTGLLAAARLLNRAADEIGLIEVGET